MILQVVPFSLSLDDPGPVLAVKGIWLRLAPRPGLLRAGPGSRIYYEEKGGSVVSVAGGVPALVPRVEAISRF